MLNDRSENRTHYLRGERRNPLKKPAARPLPARTQPTPCVAVGDDVFTLLTYMLSASPPTKEINFNYRLSLSCEENVLGIYVMTDGTEISSIEKCHLGYT